MKKFISLLIMLITLLSFNNKVLAVTFNGEAYEDIAISKDNGTKITFTYAARFYQDGTNLISYCLEPFVILTNDGTYVEYDTNNSSLNLSSEQKERIDKLAYYGYGYGNHTDKKWVTITQMLIWRTAEPTYKFNWLDNLRNRRFIYPYEEEIAELEELIAKHDKKPSFSNTKFNLSSSITLKDTNSVLSNYRIKSTTLVDAKIDGNNLIIESNSTNGDAEVVLVKEGNLGYISKYYYNPDSQNVMTRGDYEPVEIKIKGRVKKGTITVRKIDEDTKTNVSQGEANLKGATFELFDSDHKYIREFNLDKNGMYTITPLDLGKYYIKEKASGEGYILNDKEYEVDLNDDNEEVEIPITNKVVESKLIVKKLYGSKSDLDNNKMKPEKGIVFELYNSKNEKINELTTDEYGTFEVILPYGTYTLKQKTTTDNYEKVEDQIIKIGEEQDVEINLVLNDVKIPVPNANIKDSVIKRVEESWIVLSKQLLM